MRTRSHSLAPRIDSGSDGAWRSWASPWRPRSDSAAARNQASNSLLASTTATGRSLRTEMARASSRAPLRLGSHRHYPATPESHPGRQWYGRRAPRRAPALLVARAWSREYEWGGEYPPARPASGRLDESRPAPLAPLHGLPRCSRLGRSFRIALVKQPQRSVRRLRDRLRIGSQLIQAQQLSDGVQPVSNDGSANLIKGGDFGRAILGMHR